jgi:hypothetical protein
MWRWLHSISVVRMFVIKFDIYENFLRANALVQGETGIMFEGPFSWKSNYTKYLYRQGRFEPITISSLSAKGLQYPMNDILLEFRYF